MPRASAIAALAVLVALLAAPGAAGADEVRRFAVVAGHNRGGEGTRPLRYAERDAERIHDTLVRLGGVARTDARLLLGRSAAELAAALAAAEREIAGAGGRAELFFYFSGHAKDGALRLGDTGFPLAALKERLSASGASIRIAFLDACRSGAITRVKGARRAPAFAVDEGPRPATGVVILTSSSNDEDSQESDAIMGSFFTHALVSGMLGEADASGDGRVTLAEAYAHAYDRTVEGTLETTAGTQHPTFSFDLAGHGDVVLTRLAAAASWLVLPAHLAPGAFVVVEDERRVVAAEVRKPAGAPRRVALAPGAYLVKVRRDDHLEVAEVTVPARGEARLDPARLRRVPFSDDPVKGVVARMFEPRARWTVGLAGGVRAFLSGPARELYFPSMGRLGLEVELRDYLREGWLVGADFAAGSATGTVTVDGRAFPYEFDEAVLGLSVAVEPWTAPRLRPHVGGRVAVVSMERRFPGESRLAPQGLLATAPGLVLGLAWDAVPPVSLFGRARASYLLYRAEDDRSLGFVELNAGARVEF